MNENWVTLATALIVSLSAVPRLASGNTHDSNLTLLPYTFEGITATATPNGPNDVNVPARLSYSLLGTRKEIEATIANLKDCRSKETQSLIADASYNLAKKQSRNPQLIADFAKIAAGRIPVKRAGMAGNAECYASVHTAAGVYAGAFWSITAAADAHLNVLFGIVPRPEIHTGDIGNGVILSPETLDEVFLASLRANVQPPTDKLEIVPNNLSPPDLPACNSRQISRTLATAINQLYPGAAPYGPSLYKVVRIENATEFYMLPSHVFCVALVTTANGTDAEQIERNSYGLLNATHFTEQTTELSYTYGIENGRGELAVDFNGMRKSAPLQQ